MSTETRNDDASVGARERRPRRASPAAAPRRPADRAEWPSVTLCIPTFKRPAGLARLLDHVARLTYPGDLRIVVVDNDAEERAGFSLVDARRATYSFDIRCVVEEERGHTFAYNRAFALATGADTPATLVAVLDDDEYPAEDWLTLMVETLIAHEAGIVGGPVLPVFEDRDHWLARTRLFQPLRYPTGPVPAIYGAGSMLIRRDILGRYRDPFPNELAFTGGSDIDFFHRCQRDGVRFAWADDALVYESVPPTRMSVDWLLKRSFRAGTDLARVARKYQTGWRAAAVRLAKGPGLVAVSLARLPLASLRGREGVVHTLMNLARGLGRIAGEFNVTYAEYRRIHGR